MAYRKAVAPLHLIARRVYGIDTTVFRLRRYLRTHELVRCRRFGTIGHYETKRHAACKWPYSITLHQPDLFAFASEQWVHEALISRVHVFLDLITATVEDAAVVGAFLDKHQIKKWRGRQRQGRFEGTTYSSVKKNVGLQLTWYASKPSKGSGEPCAHVEWRIQGSDGVRRAELATMANILGLNYPTFWRKRLRLVQIDTEKLEQCFCCRNS